jgi:putative ABC transport system ATP-binding protein
VPALFELRDVSIRRGGRTVLVGCSAEVPDGGVTVITGPSGCGKSTLLRLCNRLLVPDAGTVRFRGTDVANLDPLALRRQVGMVLQRPTPFPGTVADNLRAAAELTDAQVVELLASVDLPAELAQRDARELSGGEQQRVCLARTLATGCEVLLVDEGTSSLDDAATATLERLVRRVAEAGRPVVWVTHDLAQAERLADHRLDMPRPADPGHPPTSGGDDGR